MFFAEDIIWDENITDQQEITDALAQGMAPFNTYLVCVRSNGRMEILSCYQALKQVNRPDELTAVACAKGKEKAYELLSVLINDWHIKKGGIKEQIKRYI